MSYSRISVPPTTLAFTRDVIHYTDEESISRLLSQHRIGVCNVRVVGDLVIGGESLLIALFEQGYEMVNILYVSDLSELTGSDLNFAQELLDA